MSIAQEFKELKSGSRELRQFSWLVGGIFLLIGAAGWHFDKGWFEIPLWIGGPLFALGSLIPIVVKPFYYAWMGLAVVMGFVMTRVLLTVFFVVVICPVGFFFKLIRRDALHRKLDRGASTYWIEKEYLIPDRSRYEKFF
jgi:hypothetical protein